MNDIRNISAIKDARTLRSSSFDRSGGNADFVTIPPGKTAVLADIKGPGCITHIWITLGSPDPFILRNALIRMSWDGEKSPSVLVPLGDFFGVGHCRTVNFSTPVLSMAPQDGKAFNCWFPMPFSAGARIEVVNESAQPIGSIYFYVDYDSFRSASEVSGLGRFHAQWRRENPCDGKSWDDYSLKYDQGWDGRGGKNRTGDGNYTILDAVGRGHYVGCHLDIFNRRNTTEHNWYGEGDDMIFVDGEKWPPAIHGTGTEDYFGMAWCPTQFYNGDYNGLLIPGGPNWEGQISCYRYHIVDPIRFRKSIRVTIEHGHNNRRSDDYSSTAYWYQEEPHAKYGILTAKMRKP